MITKGSITLPNGSDVEFGTAGAYSVGSDIYPCTVVGWSKSGKTVWVQDAEYKVISGSTYDGSAKYECWPNALRPLKKATFRKDRRFRFSGVRHGSVSFGRFSVHIDPHF